MAKKQVFRMTIGAPDESPEQAAANSKTQDIFEAHHADYIGAAIDDLTHQGRSPEESVAIGLASLINLAIDLMVQAPQVVRPHLLYSVTHCLAENFGPINATSSKHDAKH